MKILDKKKQKEQLECESKCPLIQKKSIKLDNRKIIACLYQSLKEKNNSLTN